jgi:hypothetical protein
MQVKALIVEQLEADGTLRTLQMERDDMGRPLVVAFSDEYDEPRVGPFHFLDDAYAAEFEKSIATAKWRKVSPCRFYAAGSGFHYDTSWLGIPTERHWLTYYGLSLPEYAVPTQIRICDPHTGTEYKRSVSRDDQRKRFNVYLECRSSRGAFDFVLECDFEVVGQRRFSAARYADSQTDDYGRQIDDYKGLLVPEERNRVQQFFAETIIMGDHKSVGQGFFQEGDHAKASDMTFQQVWQQSQAGVDLAALSSELATLRKAMRREAEDPCHDRAVADVGAAEEAARKADGPSVLRHLKSAGNWALDVATKIGVGLASDLIKKSISA